MGRRDRPAVGRADAHRLAVADEDAVHGRVRADDAAAILGWFNDRVGKTQRLSDLKRLDDLPRSAIGKVLKRELRDRFQGADA